MYFQTAKNFICNYVSKISANLGKSLETTLLVSKILLW